MAKRAESLQKWAHSLPYSHIAYPQGLYNQLKYIVWRALTPVHPIAHTLLEYIGFVEIRYRKYRPNGRQDFLLGTIAPDEDIKSIAQYLIEKGYGNHFVALRDRGEVVSLRYTPNFKYQYHVRIFNDGEVRGHYEYTPECHPYWHDVQVGFEQQRDYFLNLLGDKIIPSR